jgi:glutamate synthase (NADPH/NADH) large chain
MSSLADRKAAFNAQQTLTLETVAKQSEANQKDACGVGVVASKSGQASHDIIVKALEATANVQHRGGVGADGKTGDGVGLKTQLPTKFFEKKYAELSDVNLNNRALAVGTFFLPQNDPGRTEQINKIIHDVLEIEFQYKDLQWRDVPVDKSYLGEQARNSLPAIKHLMLPNKEGQTPEDFEKDLYIARRIIEKRVREEVDLQDNDTFYIPSMSSHTIVYKGLSLATELGDVYTDLKDEDYESSFGLFHQRFSTNTAPVWQRAHPYRYLAHNGEINSLQGNVNNLPLLDDAIRQAYGELAEHVLPVIQPGGSDSANVDNVIEVLSHAGWSLTEIKSLLVPPAFQDDPDISEAERQVYEYFSTIVGPWDGPATLLMSDAQKIVFGGDRNGLRPVRYVIAGDIIVAGSEDGMIDLDPASIEKRGNLKPGELLGIDLHGGGIKYDEELKKTAVEKLTQRYNIPEALAKMKSLPSGAKTQPRIYDTDEALEERLITFGYTDETITQFIYPMAQMGKETLGSMSDDAQPAYLTRDIHRPLSHYFKQRFAQVTNPPIDPIREKNVTSLKTTLGSLSLGVVDDQEAAPIKLDSPILTNSMFEELRDVIGKDNIIEIDTSFDPTAGPQAMEDRLKEILEEIAKADLTNKHIILSDEEVGTHKAAIPMLLVASAVHTRLLDIGKRGKTSINIRSAEVTDTHDYATLIGMGADTVNAYLTEEVIQAAHDNDEFDALSADKALANFKKSIEDGVLKIMSKMGISDVNSYRGARLFEALGLSKDVMAEYFPGVPSPVSGLNLTQLQDRAIAHHTRTSEANSIEYGGFIRNRKGQLPHGIDSFKIRTLQDSIKEKDPEKSYKLFKEYVDRIEHDAGENPIYLRDLMAPNRDNITPISIDDVESVESIMKRMVTGAMSMGSISKEAHETLAMAMNRIGGKSNSGEGGEDPKRLYSDKSSAVKQVASGRFGVTTDYLAEAREIQIKVAQGAKPGEGGQLMGEKVSVEISDLRFCEPGTTLISPPPHHDIYSIEDLAQLIFDMKEVNPDAKVNVKLVASEGVETIAVGVAKAGADLIHIAGGRGGTGASPQTSIVHAGQEFETALMKTHLSLQAEGFREKVKLTTDGSLRTGADIVTAAKMGGEEFGFGLQALMAVGCELARVCQKGTCATGVATQREDLRANFGKFVGKNATQDDVVDAVVRMFENIAQDVRENLAADGLKSIDEAVGRTDLLKQVAGHDLGVDLSEIIPQMDESYTPQHYIDGDRSEYTNPAEPGFISLDRNWIAAYGDEIKAGQNFTIKETVTPQHRNIGTRISGELSKHFKGVAKQTEQFATLDLKGIAGQSLGAYASNGLDINLEGAANDYVGKGLSGASITIKPDEAGQIAQSTQENIIIGNTCLYGATSGELYAAGQAGNRFGIRLSGAKAVIEGAGDSACEYMTGGQVIILGAVGNNFGAGMSGGEAFVYDVDNSLERTANDDVKGKIYAIEIGSDEETRLKEQIQRHVTKTGSKHAQAVLDDWANSVNHFKHVQPVANDNKKAAAPAAKIA